MNHSKKRPRATLPFILEERIDDHEIRTTFKAECGDGGKSLISVELAIHEFGPVLLIVP